MTNKEKRTIIEDVLNEVFAIDGRLTQIHEVHLRPYDVVRIKQNVRKAMNELHNVDFPKAATEIISYEEMLDNV